MNVFIIGVAAKNSSQLLASAYMEKELRLLGITPSVLSVSGEAQMVSAFQRVLLLGGLVLAPATGNAAIDRLLTEQIAKVCGVPMEANEKVFQQIAERNVKLTRDEVAQLSTLPQGAQVYALQDSTYPAFQLDGENIHAILLPADPVEQSGVFLNTVFPTFAQQKKYPCESHTLRVMDLSLTEVEGALKDVLTSENPCVAVYPGKEESVVRVSVRANDPQQAASACQTATKTVLERLGSYVYGVDVPNIERALLQRLEKQGLNLAVMESGSNRRAEKRLVKCKKADSVELSFPQPSPELTKAYGPVSQQGANAMAAAVSDGKTIALSIAMPTAKEKAASAFVAASFSGHTLSKEIPISGFKTVQQLADACVSQALNLARKFADAHPALPKGAVAAAAAMSGSAAPLKRSASEEGEKKQSLPKRILSGILPQKADSKSEKMRKVGILFCLCVFCGSMAYLMNHHQQGVNAQKTNDEFTNLLEQAAQGNLDGFEVDEEALAQVAPEVLDKYKPFVAINDDMQGWINIEGTNINYPVVQARDNEYYHRLNFKEEYDYYGIPYLDYECSIDVDDVSDNLIIYGHNIGNDGLMFNPISYYKELAFYKEHPIVRFDSIYKEQQYKIFGVMIVNADPAQDNGNIFKYWTEVDFDDEDDFNAYVDEVRRRSMWDIPVDVQPGDKLLTVSTCTYVFRPEARIVVVARALREGEEATVDTASAVQNQDCYFPQAYYDALKEQAKYGKVKSIEIQGGDTFELEVGQTLQLTAVTNPADAPINTCKWDSSASAVATVDAKTGLVTAVAPGEVNITAMADDGGYVDSVKVIVKAKNALDELRIVPNEITLVVGQETVLTALVEPEDAAVQLNWSSDTEEALTGSVNKSNPKELYIKAMQATEEPVTVTVTDTITGKTATCVVTLTAQAPVTGLQFQYSQYKVEVGKGVAVSALVLPNGSRLPADAEVTWTISDPSIAAVSAPVTGSSKAATKVSNTVTGLKAGTVTLTATVDIDGKTFSGSCEIVVAGANATVTADNFTMTTKSQAFLTVAVNPATASSTITAASSGLVTLQLEDDDGKGHLTYLVTSTDKVGEDTITFLSNGVQVGSCKVTVTKSVPKVTKVVISGTSPLAVGLTTDLQASFQPEGVTVDSGKYSWSSSDPAIATVDSNGHVKALAAGTVTITLTVPESPNSDKTVSGSFTLTVSPAAPTLTSLSISGGGQLTVGQSTVLSASANVDGATFTWSGGGSAVSVSADGTITAVAPGSDTVSVSATYNGVTVTSSTTITVVAAEVEPPVTTDPPSAEEPASCSCGSTDGNHTGDCPLATTSEEPEPQSLEDEGTEDEPVEGEE